MDKLVFTDTASAQTFRHNVKETVKNSNNLIEVFEKFQDFRRIDSQTAFEKLVENPEGFFDEILIAQVSPNFLTAKAKIDPAPLATMLSIDREGFLDEVSKIKITEPQYFQHKKFLFFSSGRFEVDQVAIELEADKFNTYASTERELKIVSVVENLVQAIREYDTVNPLSTSAKSILKSVFGLHLSEGTSGELIVNPEHVKKLLGK